MNTYIVFVCLESRLSDILILQNSAVPVSHFEFTDGLSLK